MSVEDPLLYRAKVHNPFTLFSSAILPAQPIPSPTLSTRNYAILLSLIALGISSFEVYQFAAGIGPVAESPWTIWWVIAMLTGSLISVVATILLQIHLLLIGAIILGCVTAPLTPNMIVESQGELLWYFIGISIFWIVVGGIQATLFCSIESELRTREAGTESLGWVKGGQ